MLLKTIAPGVCFLRPCSSAGAVVSAACLLRQNHVWITADQLVRFHKKNFKEVPCKLNFTKNPRSFEKYPALLRCFSRSCSKNVV